MNCTSAIEARMVPVRSCTTVRLTSAGMARLRRGSSAQDAVDGLDDVGAGLALDVDDHGRLRRCTSRRRACSRARPTTSATSRSSTGRAAALGDDDRPVGVGGGDLVVRRDRVGLVRAVERALRPGDVRGRRSRCAGPRAIAGTTPAAPGPPGCASPGARRPATDTLPDARTSLRRWASSVSARSLSARSGSACARSGRA